MDRSKAIELINRLVAAEAEVCKQFNQRRGGTTKKAEAEERKATAAVFQAITGEKPTPDDLAGMIEV